MGQKLGAFVSRENYEDMIVLKELLEAGKVTPVIDGTYPLSESPEAVLDVTHEPRDNGQGARRCGWRPSVRAGRLRRHR